MLSKEELIDKIDCTNLVGGLYEFRKSELVELYNQIQTYEQNKKICDYKTFTFGNKIITVNDEQHNVITEDIKKNIVILACAGSGKSTTIICRIKYLVDHGVLPERIMLTTFNVDACESLKSKIKEVFGFTPCTLVGTMDSISCRFYYRYFKKNYGVGICEYATELLKFLKTSDGKKILDKYEYLFFDEFQDVNETQFQIINEFYKNGTKIIVIGDDAQNIYQWRGSNIKYILNIKQYVPEIVIHKLTINYRSTPEIINFANNSIIHNHDQIPKDMVNFHPSIAVKPIICKYNSMYDQSKDIIDHIHNLIKANISADNIAVLSRNTIPLKSVEEEIERNKKHNQKCIQYISLISDDKNDLKPKICKDHVTLTTIHKAKGLEWEYVFLIGCEDDVFPSMLDNIGIQEERRLFYVAITRAKKHLFISFTKKTISRFIAEINSVLYDFPDFHEKYFKFNSTRIPHYENGVHKLVEMLQETDIQVMRDNEIIPKINPIVKKIHDEFQHDDYIEKYFLHADFGEFIDRYITRLISEKSKRLGDRYAKIIIASIVVSRGEYNIYSKYCNNFTINLKHITPQDDNYAIISKLSKSTDGCKVVKIDYNDEKYMITLAKKMIEVNKKFKLNGEVLVVPKQYIPNEFMESMMLSYEKYIDPSLKTNDVMKNIYEISLCGNICGDRRRLLYRDVFNEFTHNYIQMFKQIEEKYVNKLNFDNVVCKQVLCDDELDIIGEIDMFDKDKVIDFKCSTDKSCKLNWLIQLLTYAALYRKIYDKTINEIEIYNPLQGLVFTYDIKDWTGDLLLLEYLNQVRQKQMNRNFEIVIHNSDKNYKEYFTQEKKNIQDDKQNIKVNKQDELEILTKDTLEEYKKIIKEYLITIKKLLILHNNIKFKCTELKIYVEVHKKLLHKMLELKKQDIDNHVKINNTQQPYYIVFDTETTGIPRMKKRKFPPHTQLGKFHSARLVQLSWGVFDKNNKLLKFEDHIVKPDGFIIYNHYIHGITQEKALESGEDIIIVLTQFFEDLLTVSHILAHNIEFDLSIIKSESYRQKFNVIIDQLDTMNTICTMKVSAQAMKIKYPKQCELYKTLLGKEMKNLHNSKFDTLNLSQIVEKMRKLGYLSI